eukprot:gnl/MRDRNA2_/MRDRNA2_82041_c0_seq3.p2 gnl/MRDRNA2_/MRDRNA2_82041_c0~~gnl/MRDRNA2_/MRDRNA2_82041_c0_seq3.p2  ORF type:complete len:146 (+),score=26.88 gnl/MRDRNA2_/MRDRNA2_82041_c0_seq3:98-535(+)
MFALVLLSLLCGQQVQAKRMESVQELIEKHDHTSRAHPEVDFHKNMASPKDLISKAQLLEDIKMMAQGPMTFHLGGEVPPKKLKKVLLWDNIDMFHHCYNGDPQVFIHSPNDKQSSQVDGSITSLWRKLQWTKYSQTWRGVHSYC